MAGLTTFFFEYRCYYYHVLSQQLILTFPFSTVKQGSDDRVVPPSMTEYIERVLPEAVIHRLPNEGHFSYFFFCHECHRQIFSNLFGNPQGPFERQEDTFEEENSDDVLQAPVLNME